MANPTTPEGLAQVISFDHARRRHIARRLLALGVTVDQMRAVHDQHGDPGLADLWTRTRTIISLRRLTGCHHTVYDRHSTAELVELEQATVRHLMGADGRSPDQLIYSIGGRQPRHPVTRRRQHLRAWGIPA